MKHRTSKALFAYWNSVRGGRVAPHRFEIEPSRISAILPETFILERLDAETYRFRLAGTRMCEIFGQELRGTNFLDGWQAIDRLPLLRQLSTLTSHGTAGVVNIELEAGAEEPVECETLLLPIRHTRDTIDRVLGSFSPLQQSNWLGELPITHKRLITNEVIWPSYDPKAAIASVADEPPPIAPPRISRIVRSERRQFRVFDGGLARPDVDKS